jgi:serine kinase of HPr protein (carbohydrate metabolism regulator)
LIVEKLVEELSLKVLAGRDHLQRDVTAAYCGDVLSRVIAKGMRGSLWITVQTHLNTVAIASLHELSCIIIPEEAAVDERSLSKAEEEQVIILTSPMSAYTIAGKLYALGVPGIQ